MKNFKLWPEEVVVLYRTLAGDMHMVDDSEFNELVNRIYEYAEAYLGEKYSKEEEDNDDDIGARKTL